MSSNSPAESWNLELRAVRERLGAPGVASVAELRARSGLQFFDAIGSGQLPWPPIGYTLDIWPVKWETGRAVFQGIAAAAHYNLIGSVHGGWTASMLDSAVGCAIHSTLAAGMGYTTLELKVNSIRAVTVEAGPLRAEGKVIHVGGQIATAEGRLYYPPARRTRTQQRPACSSRCPHSGVETRAG